MTPATANSGAAIDPNKALVEFTEIPVRVVAWEEAWKFAGVAALCGAIGWTVEWVFGGGSGLPPVAGVLFVVIAAALSGAAFACFVSFSLRRVVDGRLLIPSEQTSATEVRPVWWARWIVTAAVIWGLFLLVSAVVFLGKRAQLGQDWLGNLSWSDITDRIVFCAIIGIVGSVGFLVVDLIEWLLLRLLSRTKNRMMALRPVQILVACVCGLLIGAGLFGALVGAAFLAMPFSVAAGLGSTFTLATLATAFPLASLVGFKSGRLMGEPSQVAADATAQPNLPAQDDFRNWNIDVETSKGGTAANGYPFYLLRESADNRLGLSRPRYCCITPRKDDLYFEFYNPSEDVRPSGGLIVFCAVALLVVIAMIGPYWFDSAPRRPYVFDNKPPPVLVFLGAMFSASMLGGIVGSIWHVLVTLLRWYDNRFKDDGRHYAMPLRSLTGFDKVHAGDAGAKIKGEDAKTGFGLTAVFEDGTMIILTGNAWNYRSTVDIHRELTNAFRVPRDAFVAEWDEYKKKSAKASEPPRPIALTSTELRPTPSAVPDVL